MRFRASSARALKVDSPPYCQFFLVVGTFIFQLLFIFLVLSSVPLRRRRWRTRWRRWTNQPILWTPLWQNQHWEQKGLWLQPNNRAPLHGNSMAPRIVVPTSKVRAPLPDITIIEGFLFSNDVRPASACLRQF